MLKRKLLEYVGTGKEAMKIIDRVRERFDAIDSIPQKYRSHVEDAYMDALHAVFYVSLAIGVCAMIASTLMREHKLHSTLDRK